MTSSTCVDQSREVEMASATTYNAALDKQIEETSAPKHGDRHQDVEIGPDAVDVERIEKVYACVEAR